MMKPYIRLSHINEMEDSKMDDSLFKDHIDGKIQTTTLYSDGSNDFQHYSKIVITANTFPNIKIDSGSVRRIDSFTHTSNFVKDKSQVNESKHIYLANKHYLEECGNNIKYLNAFFYLLAEYGYNWISKTKIFKQTENFRNTKDAIVSSNDIIQDFLDKYITITKKDTDRIGRDEMFDLFKTYFPKSLITPTQLLNSLKQKEIDYKADYRHNKLKGCYVGVIIGADLNNDIDNPLDFAVQIEKPIDDYKTKYDELLIKYNELLNQPKPKKEKKNKSTVETQSIEPTDEDLERELENFIGNIEIF